MDKKDKKKCTGFPGDCNEQQLEALAQFREIVQKQFLYEQGTGSISQSQALVDDSYLLRFLRARKFDVKKTEIMWNNSQKWRTENKVDSVIQDYVFSEISQVKQFYPHGYCKTDKLGRPIYIERIGNLNLNSLFQTTSEERLIKYYTQTYEILLQRILPACSIAKGERVDQTLTILDLKGSSMKMMSKNVYNFIQLASRIAQDNYPEILGRMFIVNAPMLFTGIWQVIKPWLDEKTRNKITIIGGKYQDKLLELIDAENLPEFLGGTCNIDCFDKSMGPWNPTGDKPLYPGEQGFDEGVYDSQQELDADNEQLKQQQQQDGDDEEEKEEDDAQNLDQLKNALMGMGLGQQNVQKAPHCPGKYEQTQSNHMVSDTPLNTQINEEADGDYDNPY